MQPGTASSDAPASHPATPAGRAIAGYVLGAKLRTTACAEVYRAERDGAVATVHVLHAALAAHPEVVRALEHQAVRAAAATRPNVMFSSILSMKWKSTASAQ